MGVALVAADLVHSVQLLLQRAVNLVQAGGAVGGWRRDGVELLLIVMVSRAWGLGGGRRCGPR